MVASYPPIAPGVGGTGAIIGAEFALTAGETLDLFIGGQGGASDSIDGGGGGGTFVTLDPSGNANNLLLVAGGGGGGRINFSEGPSEDASTGTSGNAGSANADRVEQLARAAAGGTTARVEAAGTVATAVPAFLSEFPATVSPAAWVSPCSRAGVPPSKPFLQAATAAVAPASTAGGRRWLQRRWRRHR